MSAPEHSPDDLGFTCRARKSGDVEILHHGRVVTLLRGREAVIFLTRVAGGSGRDAQQWMARVTGNYRRGNEKLAGRHVRNHQ